MPHTDHDKNHQEDCTSIAENVNQNLDNRLADFAIDCFGKILDGKKKGYKEKETKNGRDPDRYQYSKRSAPCRILCFFGQMGRGIVAGRKGGFQLASSWGAGGGY